MPSHKQVTTKEFAPRAWGAICELLGGEERIYPGTRYWKDALIVNLGSPEWENKEHNPKDLRGWHVDGDFFIHFLDSPEQGLLVIPVFTDIIKEAGGTMICPSSVGKMAQYLYEHPDGVTPQLQPRSGPLPHKPLDLTSLVCKCGDFHEMTGNVGDVILLHPLMVHSASRNRLRIPRVITNPPISLVESFNFNREDGNYSIVELKTIKELGEANAHSWRRTAPREFVTPDRLKAQEEMKKKELARMGTKPASSGSPVVA
ncbi:hypothetical protein UCRPC4_g04916 [Phaeomoniella chlamydospora]|uniref:Uncharacterized protein n=1 Tax=Phaeomoniella chlamydospora TaxID=158046 RepID=A0A0G2E611_PHACM|nr:hypothetical protein UCRPC4_g04916 [Phaeomoniella chlamydospora]